MPSAPICYALLAALALVLFFPRLGSFGFWDPYEIKIADAARNIVTGQGSLAQATHTIGRPPATVAVVAAGFRLFGVGELGGRLPIGITSLFAVLACFYAGSSMIRRRGALVGTFILATAPAFLLGARQLTTNAPLLLGTSLAVGGLVRLCWPPEDRSGGSAPMMRLVDVLCTAAGLFIGFTSGALLVGVVAPLAAVAVALVAASPNRHRGELAVGLGAAAVGGLGVAAWAWAHPTGYSALLGGMPHALVNSAVFTNALKQLGFGLFPWIALLPMAGIHALSSTTSDEEPQGREWFGRVALVCWFVSLYLTGTLEAAAVQDVLVPAAPAVLLLIGAYLDDVLDAEEVQPFAALTAALGALVIGRDFFVFPEYFVGAHMVESLRWPGPLTTMPYVMVSYAAFFAGVIGLALGVPFAPRTASPEQRRASRLILVGGAIAASLTMALFTALWLVPECSKHLSSKELYGKTKQLDPSAPIGQYHFNAQGASYYSSGKTPVTLASLDELFKFLAHPEHVFVMAGAEELPSIDQYAKQHAGSYYVVDDTSARYIMLSNRLGPGEHDLNPLRLYVSDKPPAPAHPLSINFDNKVELIGWDAPPMIGSHQEFKLKLYFKVNAPLPGSYKIFVHIDGAGTRINGDHVPLDGKFPTNYWVVGSYITDEHTVRPSDNNTGTAPGSGFYQVYMGMYLGAERLKVVSGPSDGDNRARLGGITVK
ncbi:MAG TPA: glycosyltransferase family 39 protein [Polyangia bacterium]|nr:glycosyltransferase family 39 protein [Polyangia bacterium]